MSSGAENIVMLSLLRYVGAPFLVAVFLPGKQVFFGLFMFFFVRQGGGEKKLNFWGRVGGFNKMVHNNILNSSLGQKPPPSLSPLKSFRNEEEQFQFLVVE